MRMNRFFTTMAFGLYVLLSTGAAFASGDDQKARMKSAHAVEYKSKIYGTVQSVPNEMTGTWKVDGKKVNVTKNTIIKEKHGKAEVGAYVEVKGSAEGNSMTAYKIEVKRGSKEARKIRGTIESVSTGKNGTWIVNGEEILVNESTFIREKHGKAIVGAYVEIEGVSSGKALSARNIEVKRAKR